MATSTSDAICTRRQPSAACEAIATPASTAIAVAGNQATQDGRNESSNVAEAQS